MTKAKKREKNRFFILTVKTEKSDELKKKLSPMDTTSEN